MHAIEIPAEALARTAAFRDERHMFARFDPRRTAHIVVDMQNGFLEPGAPAEVPTARDIIPNVNALSNALRAAGGTVAFLRFKTDEEAVSSWSTFYMQMFGSSHRDAMRAAFGPQSHHFALSPGLDVKAADWIVDKTRYSAFVPGTCDLPERLGPAGIDTLIISGTLTNCCCESTARDAMQRNYRVIFVADATATLSDAEHNATLGNMVALFADVMETHEVLASLRRASATQKAA